MSEFDHKTGGEMQVGEEGTANAAPKSTFDPKTNLTAKGKGRQKGVPNKITRDVKEAVLKAFDKAGGHKYLLKLANGTASDRAAFMNLLGKVIPKEINGSINHHVIPELPWLHARMVDKSDAADYESVSAAGKSLPDQRVVDGEVIRQVDGLPLSNQTGADGGGDE